MHKRAPLFFVLACTAALSVVSCKKEKHGCGGNLCFTLDGKDISVNAVRRTLPNDRSRLYWEEGADSNYKNLEIDIFGTTAARYGLDDNAGSLGDAGFRYTVVENGLQTVFMAVNGTLDVTSAGQDAWSGNFSGTVNNGTVSLELKDGIFTNVPKE